MDPFKAGAVFCRLGEDVGRRSAQRALAAMLLFTVAGCARTHAVVGGVWPMYQRSADHNAVVAKPNVHASWSYDTKAQVNGGLAYSGNTLFVDTFAGDLLALDVSTGKLLWKTHASNVLMSTPLVAGGDVIVGSGKAKHMHGGSKSVPHTTPAWGVPGGDAVHAYNAATGTEKWSYHTAGEDMPTPAYDGNSLVFTNGDFHAYALRERDGALLWRHSLRGIGTMASAALAGNRVFVSVCERFAPPHCETLAFDPETGKQLWRAPYGHSDSAPTLGGGSVFVSGTENDYSNWQRVKAGRAVIAALDPQTGATKWTYRAAVSGPYTDIGTMERAIAGTYADGVYYQPLPQNDRLAALDARTGTVRWSFASLAPIKMSPVIDGNRVYVGDVAGMLYTLDAKSGALVVARPFRHGFTASPPVIVGDTLFIVNGTSVYALPKNSPTVASL